MNKATDVARLKSVRDQMVMPQESCCLPIKANLKGMLERRLDNSNYESLTKSKKRKDDVLITDTTVNTNTSSDNDTINDSANNMSNKRNGHGLQSTYGDRNGLQQINYGDNDHKIDISDQIISAKKKHNYQSYKNACINNMITHRSNTITHGSNTITHGNNPLVSSE